MTDRVTGIVFTLAIVAMTIWLGITRALPVKAADAPLFQKGQTYSIAWDCIPEWIVQFASQQIAGGHPLNPCYAEILTVEQVRADGWLVVKDGNSTWTVNPQRMIGFSRRAPERVAE